jgi:sodium-dependent dicarboxylate transporter 2/3/5
VAEAPAPADLEVLSESEQRFDRARRRVGLWLGPILFGAVLLSPSALPPQAHRLAAVLALVIIYWISEALPLPVTALLGPTVAVALGVAPAREAFTPFGDPVLFLFLGSFVLAQALHVHGLDRRIALRILALRGAAASPYRIRLAVALTTGLISMWISNTATAAMMLPVALGLVTALAAAGSHEKPRALLLLVGLSASLGGLATPVGTPPNLITLGFLERLTGREVHFLQFMLLGTPLFLILTGVALLLVRLAAPVAAGGGEVAGYVAQQRSTLPPWGAGQRACAVAFGFAVTLWLLPGGVGLLRLPPEALLSRLTRNLDESIVALFAAVVLFLWPAGERRALTWAEATRIDWGTLLLFGGGLSLGKLMFDTKLAEVLGRGTLVLTGVESLWGLTALAIAVAIVLSELMSNTAAASMLVPLVIALAQELGVPSVPPALGVCFGASMSSVLPISTPPNAIVYGTGLVPLPFMMRVGVLLDLTSFFVILGVLRLLCPLLGLT